MKTVVLNESDSALDAFCNCHGTSIVFLDAQLAALPDDNVNKRELTRLRRKLEAAHQSKDMGQLEGWFYALVIGLKAASHTIPLAVRGEKFKNNSDKVRKGGPIKQAIRKLLKRNSGMKNKDLWDAIDAKPPKGWKVCENSLGRYIEGPPGFKEMGYSRFLNACSEVRGETQKKKA